MAIAIDLFPAYIVSHSQVAYLSTNIRQGAPAKAASIVRCLCRFQSQVQQGAPNLWAVSSQRLTMHLRRIEEAWQAWPHEEEEP